MATHRFTVEVQPDFLERQAKATPVQAVAELIWNALDADATIVDVRLNQNPLGMSIITVTDNGHGIPYAQACELFTRLGGSWKKPGGRTKTKERMLHGHEGRGRFKAFAVGRVADWRVTYDAGGECRSYDISMLQSNIREVRIGDEELTPTRSPGVEVTVSEFHRDFRSLQRESAYQDLSEIFALYLKDYRDVTIIYRGVQIDPSSAIASTGACALSEIEDNSGSYPVDLEIIEWLKATKRVIYLCTEHGFPLLHVSTNQDVVGSPRFSAYLKSPFITELHRNAALELAELKSLAYEIS